MKQMSVENDSLVTEFIFMGLTDQPEFQLPLFFVFLLNYIVTVMGNLSLMILICLNSHLHTPMYFFLFNLSFVDFCYSLVCNPKMLMGFISEKSISYTGCMTQLFFFCFFGNSECYVLTAMAYDRYVAICKPLMYTILMSPKICSLLMLASYLMGFASAVAHTTCMIRLSFCDSNIINHYMCEIFPLLQLSCSSTYANELVSSLIACIVVIVSGLVILTSYASILLNIVRMSSATGWSKAMGTCGSHIVTVSLFYGSGLLTYVKPASTESVDQGKFFSVFYILVVPMLNPLIYSLRNKDVKLAARRTMMRSTNSVKR
ncbi:olfactory receptor 143-like [Mesocricetus auratus]|uniref:Olfactory receptor n=1 Tax=Mesocricetus auratus TaxID=10036 RepID=A0A1U7QA37_MESAU|nr:olfactory receptor 143-like [Mesocricetus auratus]